ncbi:MAG: hypothetical protein HYY10_02365 [Candidatus Liptonbacteria bacterium]|nr:hypothetical protein [Candidatus Liptonbacteria bacterium]
MIVFLYGADDYRRTKEKQAVVEKFLKKHSSFGVKKVDGTVEGAVEELWEFGTNSGLFDEQRLAVLDYAWEAPEKELKEWLESVRDAKHITALLSEHGAPKKEFAFLKKEPVITKEFDALEGAAWEKFIAAEAKMRGVSLAPDAAQFLARVYAGDSWRLATELDRIALLGKGSVDKKALEALGVEIHPEFFSLMRSFSYGDRRARLAAIEGMLLTRDPAAKIFNVLAAMVPAAARRFAEYDIAIKNGKLDYEEALTDLALS